MYLFVGRACADAGEVKQALEILDVSLSGGRGANAFSYSSVLDALARQVGGMSKPFFFFCEGFLGEVFGSGRVFIGFLLVFGIGLR